MDAGIGCASTFIFEMLETDGEFQRLNDEIAQRARRIDGYLGEESWVSEDGEARSEVYYWRDRAALSELVDMDTHRIAKSMSARWIGRYRVVIADVTSVYGDPQFAILHRPGAAAPGDQSGELGDA